MAGTYKYKTLWPSFSDSVPEFIMTNEKNGWEFVQVIPSARSADTILFRREWSKSSTTIKELIEAYQWKRVGLISSIERYVLISMDTLQGVEGCTNYISAKQKQKLLNAHEMANGRYPCYYVLDRNNHTHTN